MFGVWIMPEYSVGVDLGGTRTKMVLIDSTGKILRRRSCPTFPDGGNIRPAVDTLIRMTTEFLESCESAGYTVKGIGFALPFFVDGPEWTLMQASNLPSFEGFSLFPELRAAFGEHIAATNDVNAAGMAEHLFGRGKGAERMLLMAVGTGIAVSFITLEKGLVHYTWGTTGDTGQIIVDHHDARPCPCGGHGCLEAYASAPAIRQQALQAVQSSDDDSPLRRMFLQNGDVDAAGVSSAAEKGDTAALAILEDAGRYIGVALASYLHIFSPSIILLGGGVSGARSMVLEPALRELRRLASPWHLRRLEGFEIAELGVESGAIGAASLLLFPGRYCSRGRMGKNIADRGGE